MNEAKLLRQLDRIENPPPKKKKTGGQGAQK
jgi:hypothetical protein